MPDSEIGALTPKQCAIVLARAPDHDLLPFVALGLFAGLRVTELLKLDWSKVRLSERAIIVDDGIAKTNMRRVITINDTLAAWIAPLVETAGSVVDATNFRKRRDALIRAAGIRWPDNALMHSFGSYSYSQRRDAVRISAEMGNTPQIVLKHYHALVLEQDAQRFWSLHPAT